MAKKDNPVKEAKVILMQRKRIARMDAEVLHARKKKVRAAQADIDSRRAKLIKANKTVLNAGIKLAVAEKAYRDAVSAYLPEELRD